MANDGSDFQHNKLLEIEDSQYAWIGVESWTITNGQGTKTTKPGLVKREKVKDKQTGSERLGKAKGFSITDIELVESRLDEIKGYLQSA